MTASDVPMIRCVGAVIHDAAGRLLLVRRANDPGRGQWSLPGGRVEPGESDASAVAREIHEETGLEVLTGALVGSVQRPAPAGVFVIFDYRAEVTGGLLHAGDDADEVAWVDMAKFSSFEARGLLVDELAETLTTWQVLPRV
jgi:ADP-ribose pyrophosphatase YjhB (NUDIX family)